MIFITLGSQKFQFNRLLKSIDRLIENQTFKDKVFAQIGYSDYLPHHYSYLRFLDRETFSRVIEHSDIVITHGGTGAIISAVKKGKRVIAIPRRAKYGEHVDDHQIQIVRQFGDLNLICECINCDELDAAFELLQTKKFKNYESNTQAIIENIEQFISAFKR